jgi:hypothetical protein
VGNQSCARHRKNGSGYDIDRERRKSRRSRYVKVGALGESAEDTHRNDENNDDTSRNLKDGIVTLISELTLEVSPAVTHCF